MSTIPTPNLDEFALWSSRLRERWARGAERYGDASFACPIDETVQQILEEVEDVAGWLFVLWIQARRLRGDVIDTAQREQLQEEFLRAAKVQNDAIRCGIWSVSLIEYQANRCFERWKQMRIGLARIVELSGRRELEQPRGRRGSSHTARSSD
jgi:hypothetical protein